MPDDTTNNPGNIVVNMTASFTVGDYVRCGYDGIVNSIHRQVTAQLEDLMRDDTDNAIAFRAALEKCRKAADA